MSNNKKEILQNQDIDSIETLEWLDALDNVITNDGSERALFLIQKLMDHARFRGADLPYKVTTPYVNTISPDNEIRSKGNYEIERKIRFLVRWNAVMMVLQAGRKAPELGGHISSFASSATLYDVGFNHFFHAPSKDHGGDLIYYQGHSAPGIYARSFLEGNLTREQLENFRQEVKVDGLSSYPHAWLMPNYWQFPTVSMGLGPITSIYQARFMKYLANRSLCETQNRKVWVFCGDGEMDEPESLGAISLAGREKLDNLIFVINCNLQRLDGPVRGNGKIVQELEGAFRGAGWRVIKLLWGGYWDPLFAKDKDGLLVKRMEEALDGDYQNYKAHGGAYTREHFFGKYPELKEMVANMSDEDIWRLNRGGHDPHKVFAAYAQAVKTQGQPTVILAKTVKGYGMGGAGEALNVAHNVKKLDENELKAFRDRFEIPVSDDDIKEHRFYRPADDSPEITYMRERRAALGGFLPHRSTKHTALAIPELKIFDPVLQGSGTREISTTMAFVRLLSALCRDKKIGQHIVPIVPDEARTFGMEGMFRQLGIYSSVGQLYQPVDSEQIMYYREDTKGQVLEEGISEAGGMSSWLAAATSYSIHDIPMVPFFIYYSMFGFQRIGDLAWAAGDARARGFMLGGTAGRTTLAGEGLQHQDGHSHLMAATIPNCVSYDPCFGYELAVIIHDGLKRMYQNKEDIFYYITVMNENYVQPALPKGKEEGILKGMYLLEQGDDKAALKVQLCGSGTILREAIAAKQKLEAQFGVSADVWSMTSFNELRREGLATSRWNTLHPKSKAKQSYVSTCFKTRQGPVIAATDYIQSYADQIRPFVPVSYHVLGTDGYGRSDTRENLRYFFEVNCDYIVLTALTALAEEDKYSKSDLAKAIKTLGIDPEKTNPVVV